MSAIPHTDADWLEGEEADSGVLLTYAAVADRRHVLGLVAWSYSGSPTEGKLQILDGLSQEDVIFSIDITAAGPGHITFDPPLCGSVNKALAVNLWPAGGSVVGTVNATHWLEP